MGAHFSFALDAGVVAPLLTRKFPVSSLFCFYCLLPCFLALDAGVGAHLFLALDAGVVAPLTFMVAPLFTQDLFPPLFTPLSVLTVCYLAFDTASSTPWPLL